MGPISECFGEVLLLAAGAAAVGSRLEKLEEGIGGTRVLDLICLCSAVATLEGGGLEKRYFVDFLLLLLELSLSLGVEGGEGPFVAAKVLVVMDVLAGGGDSCGEQQGEAFGCWRGETKEKYEAELNETRLHACG